VRRGRDGAVRGRRSGGSRRAAVVALVAGFVIAACVGVTAPPRGTDPASGFPYGAFTKEITDPDLGHVRIDWVFGPDGRYAEVQIPLDGQPQRGPVVRGTYTIAGDTLTIATSWPPDWGTSEHRWRMDGDALWTVFVSSDVPEDTDWFTELDTRPWRPAA
jgi:hypothetical protein